MSNLELALEAMDPGKEYTTAELIKAIWPDKGQTLIERNNLQSRLNIALKTASKYGIVERVGTTGTGGAIWRRIG